MPGHPDGAISGGAAGTAPGMIVKLPSSLSEGCTSELTPDRLMFGESRVQGTTSGVLTDLLYHPYVCAFGRCACRVLVGRTIGAKIEPVAIAADKWVRIAPSARKAGKLRLLPFAIYPFRINDRISYITLGEINCLAIRRERRRPFPKRGGNNAFTE